MKKFTRAYLFQIVQKKKEKRKEKREKNEKWDLCFIQKSYMHMYMKKSGILICNVFVSCDSRVGPTIQTAIFPFFLWYGKDYLKHTPLTALVLLREHKTRYIYKKRKNELK